MGLHSLAKDDDSFNQGVFSKIIKTLTAMANTLPKASGYCIIGVADNENTAKSYAKKHNDKYIKYSKFFVTGVNSEAEKYHADIDKYFTKLSQLIKNEPISDRDKDNISRNISIVNYFDKAVVVLKIESGDKPSVYQGKYFVRHGSNISEVEPENFSELFQRFQ